MPLTLKAVHYYEAEVRKQTLDFFSEPPACVLFFFFINEFFRMCLPLVAVLHLLAALGNN